MTTRRFPQPWSIEEVNDACFIVKDSAGQKLAYVYFEEEPGRRSAAKLFTKDEARRIAVNIAKLPELVGKRRAIVSASLVIEPQAPPLSLSLFRCGRVCPRSKRSGLCRQSLPLSFPQPAAAPGARFGRPLQTNGDGHLLVPNRTLPVMEQCSDMCGGLR